MSAIGIPDWANELGRGPDPLDLIDCNPDLSRFFGHLVTLQQRLAGSLPITIRHTAAFISRDEGVSTEIHESKIYKMMQLLCTAGVLEACVGPNARVLDGADRLPTYMIPNDVLLEYLEQNTY